VTRVPAYVSKLHVQMIQIATLDYAEKEVSVQLATPNTTALKAIKLVVRR
jgi:hypothetical protein